MDIIHTASLIFNQLAEDNIISPIQLSEEVHHYVQAKFAFINIASTCLAQQQNPLIAFETTLQAQHLSGQLTNDVYTILWWNLDLILNHYKNCLKPKPLKEKVLSTPALSTEIDCAICLNSHKKIDVLCIQSCQHEFGKECLLEWQQVSQHCPLCRADAKQIYGYKARKS